MSESLRPGVRSRWRSPISPRRLLFPLVALLVFVWALLTSVAIPNPTRAGLFSRETTALQAIKTLHTAQVQYQSQYGRYAASLTELGPPASGAPSPSSAGFIGDALASGEKQGYKFIVAAAPGGYTINADPVSYGSSGSRSFYSDQTMVIYEHYGPEPATAQSKELR